MPNDDLFLNNQTNKQEMLTDITSDSSWINEIACHAHTPCFESSYRQKLKVEFECI
jgi:hypothetical protein